MDLGKKFAKKLKFVWKFVLKSIRKSVLKSVQKFVLEKMHKHDTEPTQSVHRNVHEAQERA